MSAPYVVTSISPNLIQLEVTDMEAFATNGDVHFSIGSYLKISDGHIQVIAVVRSYKIKDPVAKAATQSSNTHNSFIVDTQPIGFIKNGVFKRGGQQIAIPPTEVEVADKDILSLIYTQSKSEDCASLEVGVLAIDHKTRVQIDGNKFFSKHIAVVGSTGSGKSCTVAKILQEAQAQSEDQKTKKIFNNSHIVIFDIHSEYLSAFPKAQNINVRNLILPYWLMNGEELEEMFIESNEQNSHNQISQFRHAVIENKKKYNLGIDATYDTPVYFSIQEVHNYIANLNAEIIGKTPEDGGLPKLSDGTLIKCREEKYFDAVLSFVAPSTATLTKASSGPFNGEFDRFIRRLEIKIGDQRLSFLLKPKNTDGTEPRTQDFGSIFQTYVGYTSNAASNLTIYDLGGIPFEETSIVVSLISRLLFDFAFHYTSLRKEAGKTGNDLPLMIVYEEAHKYVPNKALAKYTSARTAIERIAKEGRKYGISLMIVSQRPSEISDTIFSQCNNFVVMRLTNPADQTYVTRLLPDTISNITDNLPGLESREAILIGDAVQIPAVIMIDKIEHKPSSENIAVLSEWRKDWITLVLDNLANKMQKLKKAG